MCNFKSAIVTKFGEIYIYDDIDSHSEIRERARLPEDRITHTMRELRAVPVECTPCGDLLDWDAYALAIDDGCEMPQWWTPGFADEIRARIIKWLQERFASGVWPGSLTVTKKNHNQLAHLAEVGGSVYIETEGTQLPLLAKVGDYISIHAGGTQLPLLAEVGGSVSIHAEGAQLPLLAKVGGHVSIHAEGYDELLKRLKK